MHWIWTLMRPIKSIRALRRIMTEVTPEQRARLESASTKAEKTKVAEEIIEEMFPETA